MFCEKSFEVMEPCVCDGLKKQVNGILKIGHNHLRSCCHGNRFQQLLQAGQ